MANMPYWRNNARLQCNINVFIYTCTILIYQQIISQPCLAYYTKVQIKNSISANNPTETIKTDELAHTKIFDFG